MKIILAVLFNLFAIQTTFSQCDCEKYHRETGTVTQCATLPLGSDNNMELGSSLVFNGKDYFIALTIRYTSGRAKKITGNLTLGLIDNNLLAFKLLNTSSSYIGNSEVEMGTFFINDIQLI